jgi:hypothetical protein
MSSSSSHHATLKEHIDWAYAVLLQSLDDYYEACISLLYFRKELTEVWRQVVPVIVLAGAGSGFWYFVAASEYN